MGWPALASPCGGGGEAAAAVATARAGAASPARTAAPMPWRMCLGADQGCRSLRWGPAEAGRRLKSLQDARWGVWPNEQSPRS